MDEKAIIYDFVKWCYIHGIDFSYMSTAKLTGKEYCDRIMKNYFDSKQDREKLND